MSELPRAIVAAHAGLAAGLVSAVAGIAGTDVASRLVPMSNSGLGAPELLETLRMLVQRERAGTVFTDLPAGSCTMAARRLAREVPGLVVLSGVSLPMLLAFAMGAGDAPTLAVAAVEKGRTAAAILEGAPRAD